MVKRVSWRTPYLDKYEAGLNAKDANVRATPTRFSRIWALNCRKIGTIWSNVANAAFSRYKAGSFSALNTFSHWSAWRSNSSFSFFIFSSRVQHNPSSLRKLRRIKQNEFCSVLVPPFIPWRWEKFDIFCKQMMETTFIVSSTDNEQFIKMFCSSNEPSEQISINRSIYTYSHTNAHLPQLFANTRIRMGQLQKRTQYYSRVFFATSSSIALKRIWLFH